MVDQKEKDQAFIKKLSTLQRMEKEDEITNWLEEKGLLGNHLAGETFADAGFRGEEL